MPNADSGAQERATRLETELRQRHRQVRNLRVVPRESGVELHGEAESFYAKQLVIRDVMAEADLPIHSNQIAVRHGEAVKNEISKGSRILIAAGDVGVSQHYCDHLLGAGFHVERAYTGLECFKKVRLRMPDALVLIGQLPWGGVDGLLELVHSTGYLSRLRTIFVGDIAALATLCASILEKVAVVPLADAKGSSTILFGVEFPHFRGEVTGAQP